MDAGKQIEVDCRKNDNKLHDVPCHEIVLRMLRNSGEWLPGPETIRLEPTDASRDRQFLTKRDYYILGRLTLMQGLKIPQIAPDYTVEARGFVLGWVWRGDRLKEAGYVSNM